MSYGGDPANDTTDQVRLLIFDTATSTSGEIFSDAEVDWFISVTPNVFAAACLALNTMGSRFSSLSASTSAVDEKKVGDLSIKFGVASGNLQQFVIAAHGLCQELKLQSAKRAAKPYAGGISRSDKKSVRSDSDRVKPFFSRELFDNSEAVDPISGVSTST